MFGIDMVGFFAESSLPGKHQCDIIFHAIRCGLLWSAKLREREWALLVKVKRDKKKKLHAK